MRAKIKPFDRETVNVGDRLYINDISKKLGKRFIGYYKEQPHLETISVDEDERTFWHLNVKNTFMIQKSL